MYSALIFLKIQQYETFSLKYNSCMLPQITSDLNHTKCLFFSIIWLEMRCKVRPTSCNSSIVSLKILQDPFFIWLIKIISSECQTYFDNFVLFLRTSAIICVCSKCWSYFCRFFFPHSLVTLINMYSYKTTHTDIVQLYLVINQQVSVAISLR